MSELSPSERARKEHIFAQLLHDKREREAEASREASARSSEDLQERERATERERLEGSLAAFVAWAWPLYKPGLPLVWSWHYDLLSEYLQLFFERKILYLIVNIPPRTLKSFMLSIAFPAWCWAKDPLPSFIRSSADIKLSAGLNGDCRRIITSPEYQRLWGSRVQIERGRNEESDFSNKRNGAMKATAPGASIIGRGGDFILMDDILSPADARSPVVSKATFAYVDETLLQRRNNLSCSPIALIEQRVAENDMTDHLLKTLPAEDVVHISIPLVADEPLNYTFPISKRVHKRAAGDTLMPAIFTPKVVAERRMAAFVFTTQYQQKPIARAGKTFKREWFRFYGPREKGYEQQLPRTFDEIVQSWDCSFKALAESDQVAGHVWARKGPDKYLIDRHTERMSFTSTLKAIVAMRRKWPAARKILIEDKANGTAIIDVLNKKLGGVVAVEPIGSKEARAEAAAVDCESGNVYLPCPEIAPWVNTFLDLICAFPGPLNDDDVDAMDQAILKMGQGAAGIFGFYEGLLAGEQTETKSIFDQIVA